MNNYEFAELCKSVTKMKTLYVRGGWGQPLTQANKNMFIKNYEFNRSKCTDGDGIITDRRSLILNAAPDTFAMDCSCGIKSILDGFTGDVTKKYGGATYAKPCPDVDIATMLKNCSDVSTDMSTIQVGEYVVFSGKDHCGIYVGDGLVAECTYRWKDGFQLVDMNCDARKTAWKYHGKLYKYITYVAKAPETTPNVAPTSTNKVELKHIADGRLAFGTQQSDYIACVQKNLRERGYKAVATNGWLGDDTKNAIKDFQAKNAIKPTGDIDVDTINALLK